MGCCSPDYTKIQMYIDLKISLKKRDNLRSYILIERPKGAKTRYRRRFNN
ncbi:uncharacterized protein RSE6_08840 [Rhynchosporium secalis]|uniref:Uncharacterized protein n=1 Tax=Rhynchosporium secalis TaxID=38038 RepID=A0A1E1MGK6_RHYSE|nr:uncharacterized protein RSE6_08840 [Rhynchosporium secalis]